MCIQNSNRTAIPSISLCCSFVFEQGGRDQYCINKSARNNKAGVDAACEELVKEFGCR